MSDSNDELSKYLSLIASYYDIDRDNTRKNVFNTAAESIAGYPELITSGKEAQGLFKGVGSSVGEAIDDFLSERRSPRLVALETKYSHVKPYVDLFTSVHGIGAATAVKLYNEGYRTLDDIWRRAKLNNSQKVGLYWHDMIIQPIPRVEMDSIRDSIGSLLDPYGLRWDMAGSYRRQVAVVSDIDLLVQTVPGMKMEDVISILKPILPNWMSLGPKMFMGVLQLDEAHYGHRIDIRLVEPVSWYYSLMYFTGSRRFNILMRQRAGELGAKLNEYELVDKEGVSYPVGSEEEIFQLLGVKYMRPEERVKGLRVLPLV